MVERFLIQKNRVDPVYSDSWLRTTWQSIPGLDDGSLSDTNRNLLDVFMGYSTEEFKADDLSSNPVVAESFERTLTNGQMRPSAAQRGLLAEIKKKAPEYYTDRLAKPIRERRDSVMKSIETSLPNLMAKDLGGIYQRAR